MGKARVKLNDLLTVECPECCSGNAEWSVMHINRSGIVEGRLKTHDVSTVFVLGCGYCSHTVRIIDAESIAQCMTEAGLQKLKES